MKEGPTTDSSLDAKIQLQIEDPSGIEPIPQSPSGARRMILNMGPQHPSTHGVLRVILELDGETIVNAHLRSATCTRALRSSLR